VKVLIVGCGEIGSPTAVSGSGAANFLALAEAMGTAAEARGLSPQIATLLAEQTLIGSAALIGRGMRPLELSQQVVGAAAGEARDLRAKAS
jgi:pyrroline-5-carboxylate reductase